MSDVVSSDPYLVTRVQESLPLLVTPDNLHDRMVREWRKDQNAKPISLDTKLQATLNKCPSQWIDGIAVYLGYSPKGEKRNKVAAIRAHLLEKPKLKVVASGLPTEAQQALAMVNASGWLRCGELARRFGAEDNDGWWWEEDAPQSIIGQLRLAGLLYVGKAPVSRRNLTVAVIPVELRPLLAQLLAT
jgi:hypothetical protein